ncbi:MAG: TonB-dependent receptor [Saprospiraceae bacterium]|nr:TonB-dependent receptor [Saprospiraceae bacterium]
MQHKYNGLCTAYIKGLISIFLITQSVFLAGQNFTISGYVEDASSGEKLIGANLIDLNSGEGTITNTFGYFSLTLPKDSVRLAITYIGYQSGLKELFLEEDTQIEIALSDNVELQEVVITAKQTELIEQRTQMSTVEIPIAQIKKVPALLGETDVLKALQLLPGVQSGGEGQSGLYVRGGSPDQNLILLDGVPVYNASHLFGFFSVFNADAIKDVKLIKGGFPARYGGRLSSVLDINMKEGNMQEMHGSASIGFVASKFTLEGPIKKDKSSFIVSARRTYIDQLLKPFIAKSFEDEGIKGGTGYYFYDLNAKVNYKFSNTDRLYLSFYGGKDKFFLDQEDLVGRFKDRFENDFGWGNITSALRWNHVWTPKLFSNTMVTYSKYNLDLGSLYSTIDSTNNLRDDISLGYDSGIIDYAAKIDFDYIPSPEHFIRFGISGIHHHFFPGEFNLNQVVDEYDYFFSTVVKQNEIKAQEIAAYVEDDISINDRLKMNVGLHLSTFLVEGENYNSIQPRLGARYLLPNDFALKASFATMRQYIQLLAFEGIGLPTDLWLPTTKKVKPQDSYQVALGLAKTIGKDYEFSIEAYFKEMSNLLSYADGEGLFSLSDWQDRVIQGDGKAYGAEFFIQKKSGRLSGWLGYTLAWSLRQFDELNRGEEFPFRYDRRHDFSIVANYELTPKINISGTWIYGSGNAVTLEDSKYQGTYNGDFPYEGAFYSDRNNYRMRSYHRLDIGINFVKKREKYERTWSFGAYNTYSNKNPFFVYTENNYLGSNPDGTPNSETVLKQASLFPIIPYVTYRIDF